MYLMMLDDVVFGFYVQPTANWVATIQLLHDMIHIAIFMSRYDTYRGTFSGMRKAF